MLVILFFIICFALIILNCEILSLFQIFNSKNVIIISITEIIILLFILFKYFKKIINFKKTEAINKIINAFKLDKSLFVFAVFFGLMVLIMGFFAYYFLPLESDARMYHFSRIFEYIHQQSFLHFDTNEVRIIIMLIYSSMFYSYFYVLK